MSNAADAAQANQAVRQKTLRGSAFGHLAEWRDGVARGLLAVKP